MGCKRAEIWDYISNKIQEDISLRLHGTLRCEHSFLFVCKDKYKIKTVELSFSTCTVQAMFLQAISFRLDLRMYWFLYHVLSE